MHSIQLPTKQYIELQILDFVEVRDCYHASYSTPMGHFDENYISCMAKKMKYL